MARFDLLKTPLDGLVVIQRMAMEDPRGFLSRLWCAEEFSQFGWSSPIAQINQTMTRRRGAVRGMHFQHPPHAESKFVTCVRGEIFDVAVDLRYQSPTFLKWHGEVLSSKNRRSLLIPKGYAHGFQTLCEECELIYLHSDPYSPKAEGALNPTDPLLGIAWPLSITEMSERDKRHPLLTSDYQGVVL